MEGIRHTRTPALFEDVYDWAYRLCAKLSHSEVPLSELWQISVQLALPTQGTRTELCQRIASTLLFDLDNAQSQPFAFHKDAATILHTAVGQKRQREEEAAEQQKVQRLFVEEEPLVIDEPIAEEQKVESILDHMETMPVDMQSLLLSWLPYDTLGQLAGVSKQYANLVSEEKEKRSVVLKETCGDIMPICLQSAVAQGLVYKVRFLLHNGIAHKYVKESLGMLPTESAEINMLLYWATPAKDRAPLGEQLLYKAVDANLPETVKALSDVGVAPGALAYPVMIDAASHGHDDLVALFLQQNISPDTRLRDGTTALMAAAKGGHLESIDALLAAGADPSLVDKAGRTAFEYAVLNNQLDAARRIARDYKIDSGILDAALLGATSTKMARILLHLGANIDTTNAQGDTPLIRQARAYNVPLVQFLLRRGAKVNLQNNQGNTALVEVLIPREKMTAQLKTDKRAIAVALLDAGADPNIANLNQETALMKAAVTEMPVAVDALLRANADVTARDSMGRSALSFANLSKGANKRVIALLEKSGAE